MSKLVTLASADGHAHFAWGALLIHLWWDAMSLESVVVAGDLGRQMAARHQSIGSISIAANGMSLPSLDAQRAGSEALTESQAWLLCNGVVLEGEGFWASAARACYTAMQFVVRHKCPQKVFGSDTDAVRWAASFVPGIAGNEQSLLDALRSERRSLGSV